MHHCGTLRSNGREAQKCVAGLRAPSSRPDAPAAAAVGGGGRAHFFKLRREWARMSNLLGTGQVAEEALAARLGVSVARLQAMLQGLESRDVSLDSPSAHTGLSPLDQLVAEVNQVISAPRPRGAAALHGHNKARTSACAFARRFHVTPRSLLALLFARG